MTNSTQQDWLKLTIAEDFIVRGGGLAQFNKVVLEASNITIDADGIVDANGRGEYVVLRSVVKLWLYFMLVGEICIGILG